MDTSDQPPRVDDRAQDEPAQADQPARGDVPTVPVGIVGAPVGGHATPGDAAAPESAHAAPEVLGDPPAPASMDRGKLFGYLAIYSFLRLALVVALTALLTFVMPLIVALLFAIIVSLPLSWLLFARPRAKVNDAIAQASSQRRAERARLQSALSGDTTT